MNENQSAALRISEKGLVADESIMTMQIIKLCPKLIIEGTRLTGKTDLALALNEHPRIVGVRRYRYHSPIVSAEWNGFAKNPYGSSLFDFAEPYETRALKSSRVIA